MYSVFQFFSSKNLFMSNMERYIREIIKSYCWTEEPQFAGYVENYLW